MSVRDDLTALRGETGEILSVLKGRRPCRFDICHPEADCTCGSRDDSPYIDYAALRPIGAAAMASAFMVLRHSLKVVPEGYFRIRPRRDVLIACVCRRGLTLRPGFHQCGCGRTFAFTGKRLYVLPAE